MVQGRERGEKIGHGSRKRERREDWPGFKERTDDKWQTRIEDLASKYYGLLS